MSILDYTYSWHFRIITYSTKSTCVKRVSIFNDKSMKNIFSLFVCGAVLCVAMASCYVIETGHVTPCLNICDGSAQELTLEADFDSIWIGLYIYPQGDCEIDNVLYTAKGEWFDLEIEKIRHNKALVHISLQENNTADTRLFALSLATNLPSVQANTSHIVQYPKDWIEQ